MMNDDIFESTLTRLAAYHGLKFQVSESVEYSSSSAGRIYDTSMQNLRFMAGFCSMSGVPILTTAACFDRLTAIKKLFDIYLDLGWHRTHSISLVSDFERTASIIAAESVEELSVKLAVCGF